MFIDSGSSEIDIGDGGQSSAEGLGALLGPQWVQGRTLVGVQGAKLLKLREFCRFSPGGGALQLHLYGVVRPQDWKIDPSAD